MMCCGTTWKYLIVCLHISREASQFVFLAWIINQNIDVSYDFVSNNSYCTLEPTGCKF